MAAIAPSRRSRTTARRGSACCSSTSARRTRRRRARCGATSRNSCPIRASSRSRACVWKPLLHGVDPAHAARRGRRRSTRRSGPTTARRCSCTACEQKTLLRGYLGQRLKRAGLPSDLCPVELGMRYGKPSIGSRARQAARGGLRTDPRAAALSAVRGEHDGVGVRRRGRAPRARCAACPALRFVETLSRRRRATSGRWRRTSTTTGCKHGRPDRLVLSFHGVPRRTLELGDPYHCQCHDDRAAARARARARAPSNGRSTFQSRFGRAEWLKPYTADTLVALGQGGRARGSTCSARASSPIASRRWRRSASRAGSAFLKAGGARVPRHSLPQRASGVDRRAGRPRVAPSRGLARRAARTPRPASSRCCGPRRWARRS